MAWGMEALHTHLLFLQSSEQFLQSRIRLHSHFYDRLMATCSSNDYHVRIKIVLKDSAFMYQFIAYRRYFFCFHARHPFATVSRLQCRLLLALNLACTSQSIKDTSPGLIPKSMKWAIFAAGEGKLHGTTRFFSLFLYMVCWGPPGLEGQKSETVAVGERDFPLSGHAAHANTAIPPVLSTLQTRQESATTVAHTSE